MLLSGPVAGPLLFVNYTAQGAPGNVSRGNGDAAYFSYDAVQRLSAVLDDFAGIGSDVTYYYGRNAAGQINALTRTNDDYAWRRHYQVDRNYVTNGRNQYRASGATGISYDANGNLLSAGGAGSYYYDIENRLIGAPGAVSLAYDPLGRLWQVAVNGAATTTFLYDGDALVAEYGAAGQVLRRHLHSVGADVPVVTYEGADLATPRYLFADHQGSIVALSDGAGAVATINAYDEYGIPAAAANSGRFQYTGQVWLAELGMYYFKARIYSPTLGRFLQTDPVGYQGGINLYAYVGDDPVNNADPDGESITEIGFLIYDVGTAISHVANGASAGELLNDAANIALDIEPIPGLREVKGAVEVGRAVEHGVQAARAERRVTTLRPGPHARESIPAHPGRPTAAEQRQINRMGDTHGCHTCGARESGHPDGHWTGDHQGPTGRNPNGEPQSYYPHCRNCSNRQGGEVSQANRRDRAVEPPPPRRRNRGDPI